MAALSSPPDARCSPTTQRYFLDDPIDPPKSPMYDYASKDCPTPTISSAPSSRSPSPDFARPVPDQLLYSPSTLSSLSLDVADDDPDDQVYDDSEVISPSYRADQLDQKDLTSTDLDESLGLSSDRSHWKTHIPAADDSSIQPEPSRHVDYLSHEWKEEEDIWSSWRYIAARRNAYSNGVRLENASWRTWAKFKLNLGTVSPEALNWLKDCDVTWLYGPLKTHRSHIETPANSSTSPPPTRLETPGIFPDRKPILKKKTASEAILQRSLSQHTLLQHAGAILRAQEANNGQFRSAFSDPAGCAGMGDQTPVASTDDTASSTPLSSAPGPNERRHIHFNNEVSQCIAVEAKDGEEEHEKWPVTLEDGISTNDNIAMEQAPPTTPPDSRSPPRSSSSSISNENKTIAPLPSTTLKYRGDTPPPAGSLLSRWYNSYSTSSLSRTSSMETLRPSPPPPSFPVDEDDNHSDLGQWQSQRHHQSSSWLSDSEDELELDQDLTSGDVMPYEDGDWPDTGGVLDKMVDAVNTARDIAHVIWNVGWRR